MEFSVDPDLELIADAVGAVCAGFDDEYWSACAAKHDPEYVSRTTGTVAFVSGEEDVVNAAELEQMTPQQRFDVVEASRIRTWDEVPDSLRAEVESTARRLGEQRRARA